MNWRKSYPSEIARVGIVRSSESPVTKKVVGLSWLYAEPMSVTCHAICDDNSRRGVVAPLGISHEPNRPPNKR